MGERKYRLFAQRKRLRKKLEGKLRELEDQRFYLECLYYDSYLPMVVSFERYFNADLKVNQLYKQMDMIAKEIYDKYEHKAYVVG